MSIKDIITVPDETLKKISEPLEKVSINEKKLLFINIQGAKLKRSSELQDANIKTLSNFIYKVFNQIKIIDSGKDKDEEFVPIYLR